MDTPTAAARTALLIRASADRVFEALVDPEVTRRFWFTHGSGRLEAGRTVRWDWGMFGVSAEVEVRVCEPNRRLVYAWPREGATNEVEWILEPRDDGRSTLLHVTESGFRSDDPLRLAELVADSTGGFNLVLAGLKAWLEHGLELGLIADRFPDAIVPRG